VKKRLVVLLLLLSTAVSADDLFMVRSQLSFPQAMTVLQQTIRDNGYMVSRVQRIDTGLTKSGYKTDKYRVVFFGNLQEVRKLSDQYPQLIAYLPLKLAIFAETMKRYCCPPVLNICVPSSRTHSYKPHSITGKPIFRTSWSRYASPSSRGYAGRGII
jgi:hypothetical protein